MRSGYVFEAHASFLASTTSCSTSFSSRRVRAAGGGFGRRRLRRTGARADFEQAFVQEMGDYFVGGIGIDLQFRA